MLAMKTASLATRTARVCLRPAIPLAKSTSSRSTFTIRSQPSSKLAFITGPAGCWHDKRTFGSSAVRKGVEDEASDSSSMAEVTYDEVKDLMLSSYPSQRSLLIDVREPDELVEYGEYHGAYNVPLGQVQKALQTSDDKTFHGLYGFQRPDHETSTLIFCCMSGKRSAQATDIALKLGFTKSMNYKGGWHDYHKQLGVPFKRGDASKPSTGSK